MWLFWVSETTTLDKQRSLNDWFLCWKRTPCTPCEAAFQSPKQVFEFYPFLHYRTQRSTCLGITFIIVLRKFFIMHECFKPWLVFHTGRTTFYGSKFKAHMKCPRCRIKQVNMWLLQIQLPYFDSSHVTLVEANKCY